MKTNEFDCIVIGAGHAGAEAAHAAARLGLATALITLSKSTVAQMSCNPAIGGLAKGQIVREIDALGAMPVVDHVLLDLPQGVVRKLLCDHFK